jgi:hypothetical protein
VANLLPVLPGEKTVVSFTLSTVPGTDGWQIDTIHIDPYSKN